MTEQPTPADRDARKETPSEERVLTPAAQRALAEAAERRRNEAELWPPEHGGRGGLEPTRYGDWEKKGLAVDF